MSQKVFSCLRFVLIPVLAFLLSLFFFSKQIQLWDGGCCEAVQGQSRICYKNLCQARWFLTKCSRYCHISFSFFAFQRHIKSGLSFSFSCALDVNVPRWSVNLRLLKVWGQQVPTVLRAVCTSEVSKTNWLTSASDCRLMRQLSSVRSVFSLPHCLVVMISLLQRCKFHFLTPPSPARNLKVKWGQHYLCSQKAHGLVPCLSQSHGSRTI